MEVWKDVVDYKDSYEVSNLGKVRSYRNYQWGLKDKPHIKKQVSCGRQMDYLCVNLLGKVKRVHRLVAKAFIPNPENKKYVNHIDGDKTNNHVSNLEWCTAKENTKHAYDIGLIDNKGENCVTSKLTKKDVIEIRKTYKTGNYTQKEISEAWGVSRSQIGFIVNRKRWKHIKEEVSYRKS